MSRRPTGFGIVAREEHEVSVQAGIWNFDGRPVDAGLIAAFSESLKEQGPDGESTYVDGLVALLYRPFHTTVESRREKQPYVSRRGFILIWDGRLDNREDLLADLQSNLGPEPTDVAIVAAAFDRWETDCFRRIIGDWAVSVWKAERRELILAVDYMAIRHIFYYLKRNQISWSTDLSPLVLLSGDKFHIADEYVAGYLAHDPDAHLTPYCEIREVPPGHFVQVLNGTARVVRHWWFSVRSRIRYKNDKEYEEDFRRLLSQSVRRRLRSSSPILAELSGGLDSSSIVCLADDILAREGAQTPGLDTLSMYDKTEPHGDDWIYFPMIEARRGAAGVHIDTSAGVTSQSSLGYSGFSALPGNLGSELQIETQRAGVVRAGGYRVVLSGIGGDEFMGGIPDPTAYLADLVVRFRVIKLVRELTNWSLVKRRPMLHLLGQVFTDFLPISLRQYVSKHARVEPWINKEFAKRTKIPRRLLDVEQPFGAWLPTRRSYIGGVVAMGNKAAKWVPPTQAMEEVRYPYLDQNLIEFVLSIPADQLLRPGERRSLMRRSLTGLVPHEVLSRKTKQLGARTPVIELQRTLAEIQILFDSPLSTRFGCVNENLFLAELRAARHGKQIHIVRMLRTIALELWLRDLDSRGLIDVLKVSSTNRTSTSLRRDSREIRHPQFDQSR